jgi:hypothetical protein
VINLLQSMCLRTKQPNINQYHLSRQHVFIPLSSLIAQKWLQ